MELEKQWNALCIVISVNLLQNAYIKRIYSNKIMAFSKKKKKKKKDIPDKNCRLNLRMNL